MSNPYRSELDSVVAALETECQKTTEQAKTILHLEWLCAKLATRPARVVLYVLSVPAVIALFFYTILLFVTSVNWTISGRLGERCYRDGTCNAPFECRRTDGISRPNRECGKP